MRYAIASLMATIGVLLTVVAAPGLFVRSTLYDTDTVVARVDTALDDERVQLAIAEKVTDEVFILAEIDRDAAEAAIEAAQDSEAAEGTEGAGAVEGEEATEGEPPVEDEEATEGDDAAALPELDLVLDLPIAGAIQDQTTERAMAILASNTLDEPLLAATRESHEKWLVVVDGEANAEVVATNGEVTIDLEPVVDATLLELSRDPLLGFLADVEVPDGSATFVVVHDGQGGGIWWTMARVLPDWAGLATFFAIALIVAAIALSTDRDRIMLGAGVGLAAIALVTAGLVWAFRALVSTVFIRDEVPRGAFDAVYGTLSGPLIGMEIRIAIFGAVLAAIGGVMGFVLDWRAERLWAGEEQRHLQAQSNGQNGQGQPPITYPTGDDSPIYVSPFEESGLPLPPQHRDKH